MLLFTISIRKFRAIKEAVKLQRNDGLVMNQLFSRKAFLPYSRLVCNFRHFGAFSELDFKGLSDLKTWMDYFVHPARSCEYLKNCFPASTASHISELRSKCSYPSVYSFFGRFLKKIPAFRTN